VSFVLDKFAIGQIFSRRTSCFLGQCRANSALQSSLFSKITLWVPHNKAVRLRKSGNIRPKRAVIIFVVQWVKSAGQNYILPSFPLFFFACVIFSCF